MEEINKTAARDENRENEEQTMTPKFQGWFK